MDFPDYSASLAKSKIDDLRRLADPALGTTRYTDERWAARLHATLLSSYHASQHNPRWKSDPFLSQCVEDEQRLPLTLAAMFDLVSNIEYCRGRMVSSNWIYCNREDQPVRRAYYSFLKQCPRCCLEGLDPRIVGAQHKPSSHHIGEITTTLTTLMLRLFAAVAAEPLVVAAVLKQSHDVDAIAWGERLLLLFEIKSSPMVTFPLVTDLALPLTTEADDGVMEYGRHSLIDVALDGRDLALYIPHRERRVALGRAGPPPWPYPVADQAFSEPATWLDYFSAWLELFYAYSVPKTKRTGRIKALAYLVNGWGDEVDSNKTKPGLGRTDDLKKGTYQLLKFGAYYRDDDHPLQVRSALVANLDPLFLRDEYLAKLEDIRWGRGQHFELRDAVYEIAREELHFLYEGIVALNRPVLNDPILQRLFDFGGLDEALAAGELTALLAEWSAGSTAAEAGSA